MVKNETKHKIKNVVIGVLCALVVVATVGATIAFSKVDSIDLGKSSYQIASIVDGELDKTDKSSLVSNFVELKGLEIGVKEDATAGYVVHYFDVNKEYISSTDKLDGDYSLEAPEDAVFVRVEIVPTNDNYISVFEKGEYVSQVKVSIIK